MHWLWLMGGSVLIVIGLLVEGRLAEWLEIGKRSPKFHRLEIIGTWLIVVGVAWELAVTINAEFEVAKATQYAATANLEAKRAENEAAQAKEHVSSNALEVATLNKEIADERLIADEVETEAAPRTLTPLQSSKLTTILNGVSNSPTVWIVCPPNDEECSGFADDFEVALEHAHWKTIRIEREPIKTPEPMLTSTNWNNRWLHGLAVVHNTKQFPASANTLYLAISQINCVPHGSLVDFAVGDFPTDEVWLVIAPRPPIGMENTLVPRDFEPTQSDLTALSKFSWTNTVVVSDSKDNFDASRLASQIKSAIGKNAETNFLFWRNVNWFRDGVEIWVSRGSSSLVDEQADALQSALNNAKINTVKYATSTIPSGWLLIRVGPMPTRLETKENGQIDFLEKSIGQ
ncbi:MAG TPA: hypothetical protein VMA35_07565 [Candidatus Sulfopaludibacter sp.]|nr:hypothetical protein [Candidatus Sulfopaludibacter sp.]